MSQEYPPWNIATDVRMNCSDCSAECCKHIAIPLTDPATAEDFQAIVKYLAHENVSVYLDNDDEWIVEWKTRCTQLDGNRCRAYKNGNPPRICTEYELHTCVMNEPEPWWQVLFENADEAKRYAAQQGHNITSQTTCTGDCHGLSIPISTPESLEDYDDLRWYIAHREVKVLRCNAQWFVRVAAVRRGGCNTCVSKLPQHDILLESWDDVIEHCKNIGLYNQEGNTKKITLTEK